MQSVSSFRTDGSRRGVGYNTVIGLLMFALVLTTVVVIFYPRWVKTEGGFGELVGIDTVENYMKKGDEAYRLQDFGIALEYYKKTVKKFPDDDRASEAELKIALTYAARKSLPKARDELDAIYEKYEDENILSSTTLAAIKGARERYEGSDTENGEWYCCDFKDLGCIRTYELCSEKCSEGC